MKDIFSKKQRKEYLIGFLLIGALLFSFAFFMVPNMNNTPIGGKDQTFTTDPNSAADSGTQSYSGTGIKNNVTEYGEGYFQNNELELWKGDEASITIPEEWQGNKVMSNITKIHEENKYWVNDTFETGYDSNYWSGEVSNVNYESDVQFNHSDQVGEESIYINCTNEVAKTWDAVDTYWNYSFYLDREKIDYRYWNINFDYKFKWDNPDWFPGGGGANFYAKLYVNGIEAAFKIKNLKATEFTNDTWVSAILDPFQAEMYGLDIPGRIDLTIGTFFGNNVDLSTATGSLLINIDNVELDIPNIPKPEQINLTLNDETNRHSYKINNLNDDFGIGQVEISDKWNGSEGGETHYFNFTTNSTADVEIYSDFFVDATSAKYTQTDLNEDGSVFTVENNTRVSWDMYFDVSIPGTYDTNYYFNISKPKNWNVTHVYNSYGNDKIENVTETSGPGNTTLQIPSDIIIGGRWHIVAESPNFILNGFIWNATNGEWQKEKDFYIGDTLKVNATIVDEYEVIPNIESTNGIREIYYPNGTIWDEKTEEKPINSDYTVNFTEFQIPQSAPAGEYSVLIKYNETSQMGFLKRNFNVIHETELKRANDQNEKISIFSGDYFNLKVNYTDLDFEAGIGTSDDPAYVNYTIYNESSDEFRSGVMSYSSPGKYFKELKAEDWDWGYYNVSISASKDYYDSKHISNLIQIEVTQTTTIESSDEGGINVAYGNNATIDINYKTTEGTGIPNAIIECDWPKEYYFVNETGTDGYYQILLNTSTEKIGSQTILKINATKSGYETQNINIPLNIRTIFTEIDYTQPAPVELYGNVSFTVNYIDTDNKKNISGATFRISNSSESEYWDQSDFYYTDNGESYTLSFNSSYFGSIGSYSIYVSANKTHYATSSTILSVFIEEIGTTLDNITLNGIETTDYEIPIRASLNITVSYYELFKGTKLSNATLQLEGEGIFENLRENDDSPTYSFIMNTTKLGIGIQFLTITAQKPNYETSTARLRIEVNAIKINITTISGENIFTIQSGKSFTLQIKLKNEDFGGLLTKANVTYSYPYGQGSLDGPDADGYFTKTFDNFNPGETYTFNLFVSAGDDYQSEPYEVSVTVNVPESDGGEQSLLLFQILTFVGIGAAVAITGYLIAYQKVLKYPKSIRKIHKYKKVVKKGKDKEMDIQTRKDAIKSRYNDEFEERMPGKPKKDIIDDKDITDRKGIRDKGDKDSNKNDKVKN